VRIPQTPVTALTSFLAVIASTAVAVVFAAAAIAGPPLTGDVTVCVRIDGAANERGSIRILQVSVAEMNRNDRSPSAACDRNEQQLVWEHEPAR